VGEVIKDIGLDLSAENLDILFAWMDRDNLGKGVCVSGRTHSIV